MQTFLPYSNFKRCAKVLDRQRLGKQRVEAMQILRILLNETDSKAWRNHPAVKMWKGYEGVLAQYGKIICEEWIRRGYKDTILPYFKERESNNTDIPKFIRSLKFRQSHQSNLLRKDYTHYSKYFDIVTDLPYIWPTDNK